VPTQWQTMVSNQSVRLYGKQKKKPEPPERKLPEARASAGVCCEKEAIPLLAGFAGHGGAKVLLKYSQNCGATTDQGPREGSD
jgi:hypothetical protein